jgi:hypothetical protein
VNLAAGRHSLSVRRTGFSLAPGNGGAAVLDSAFLTRAAESSASLHALDLAAAPHALCYASYQSLELVSR